MDLHVSKWMHRYRGGEQGAQGPLLLRHPSCRLFLTAFLINNDLNKDITKYNIVMSCIIRKKPQENFKNTLNVFFIFEVSPFCFQQK